SNTPKVGKMILVTGETHDLNIVSGAVNIDLASNSRKEVMLNDIHIYPNPTTGLLQINLNNAIVNEFEALNNTGQIILPKSKLNATQIDLSKFMAGVYYLKFYSNEGMVTKKVIITK
ncbi:MAG TPA: T9SS type A sorting domain-containing protein, partial [Saprospiraceae bacterium]|nr:T9SS type A sorting domain-containing protein [Saprospiraceae bacterium]